MTHKANAKRRTGFLARLRSDESGNVIAMMAAAIFPIVGIIGGGLDMSRIYLTRTRLQAACDAGALAGRKQMGIGTWAANGGKANTEAVRMFNLNFATNAYGTISTTPTFTENSGNVAGSASATIPMTLMRLFGSDVSSVNVSCNAAMSIPNTDIMFVLDTTGSMAFAPDGTTATSTNPSKIAGLRKVTKCFYEALAKFNISSVTPADCNETTDPSGGNAVGSQIRFGFVAYSSNVNVGKLLPNNYLVDSFTYQSRQALLTPVWVYALGAESGISYGGYTNPVTPTSPSSWTSYTTSNTSANQTINGISYATVLSEASCPRAAPSAATAVGTAYGTQTSTSSTAPVYPSTAPVPFGNYTGTLPQTRNFYQYAVDNKRCRLQYGSAAFNKTRTGTTNKPVVSWTQYTDTFTQWEYKPRVLTVGGLKAGGSSWNNSVAVPVGFTTETLLVSGTNGLTYNRVANVNANWDGCIEERKTLRTNSWNPYPAATSSPDLDLKSVPTGDDDTKWKPSLNGGIWTRYNGSTKYFPSIVTSSNLSNNAGYSCPSQARLLTEYNNAAGATSFSNYIDGLVAVGATYHDIGMLWGGRLLMPDGIFSANNSSGTASGIDRNIIYMTDGDTDSSTTTNTAYGRAWWDRRQEVDVNIGPEETDVDVKVNARFEAICDQLTNNENVTVWVVSFGGTGISATTKARLKRCSTNGDFEADNLHFFDATNTAQLLTSFKAIASAISQLRLTN